MTSCTHKSFSFNFSFACAFRVGGRLITGNHTEAWMTFLDRIVQKFELKNHRKTLRECRSMEILNDSNKLSLSRCVPSQLFFERLSFIMKPLSHTE